MKEQQEREYFYRSLNSKIVHDDTNVPQIHLFSVQTRKKDYNFIPPHHSEILNGIYQSLTLEKLLKHIHYQFDDQGLVYTLLHRIYDSSDHQIEYYVPELVYMAVKKKCKPICRLLIDKSAKNQALRRLILWNIKAFTVLMKQKDPQLKKFISDLEYKVVETVSDNIKFIQSEKAISMLTTASLILKRLPKEEQKQSLKKFVEVYNDKILKNLNHTIIIPFRKKKDETISSNYITRIIQDNCSCFPTRKRVPYRIILETIDQREIKVKHQYEHNNKLKNKEEVQADSGLYKQVFQEVQKEFKVKSSLIRELEKASYPYIIDNEEYAKIMELGKFAKQVESNEKEQSKKRRKGIIIRKGGDTMKNRLNIPNLSNNRSGNQNILFRSGRFQIKNTEELKKYEAIYIPTLPSNKRNSDIDAFPKGYWIAVDDLRKRFSERSNNSSCRQSNVKIFEEEPQYEGNIGEKPIWGDLWNETVKKLQKKSPFKGYKSLRFRNMVVKGGDDLRQQIICMQLIYKMESIMKDAALDVFIKPYEIIVLSENSGMLEFVSNSISIDAMKKQKQMDLLQFYTETFNSQEKFINAKTKFIRSLAGSSILTYVLRLKDRHNGNILLDCDGNIIHIDFGFILGMSPGGLNFQSSPFKLTEEYILLIGGKNSTDYNYFVDLFVQGMMALRDRFDQICLILEIMMEGSDLDCFKDFNLLGFKKRMQLTSNDDKFRIFCEGLIEKSYLNSRTVHYDRFQQYTNGIMP